MRPAIIAPTLTLIVLMLVTWPRFANPDDIFFHLSLDGTYWGEPTGDLVVIRPILTDGLEWLYRLAAGVPWYTGLHLAAQLGAWIVLVYTFLVHRASATWFGWVAAAAVAAGIGLRLWMTMQYTSTAALLITAGIALHASSDRPDGWTARAAVAGLAAGMGGLLRWEMLPVLLLVAGPWLILARPPLERRKAHVLFLGVMVAVTALGFLHQEAKYWGDDTWSQYRSYNATRGALNDGPGLDEFDGISPAMAARGWSDNDVELLSQFAMVDPVVFSAENLDALSDELGGSPRSIGVAIQQVEVGQPLLFVVAAVVGWSAIALTDRRGRSILLASGVTAVVLLTYAAFYLHLPFYVSASMAFLLATMSVLQPPSGLHRGAVAAAGLLAIVTTASAVQTAIVNDENRELHDGAVAFLTELGELDPDGTFFMQWPDPTRHIGPLGTGHVPDVDLVIGSWFVGSPQYEERVSSIGQGSVMDIVLADPDVYLVTDSTRIAQYQTFVDQHTFGGGTLVPVLRYQFDESTELVALTGVAG